MVFPNEIFAIEPEDSQKNLVLDGVNATPTKSNLLALLLICLHNKHCTCNRVKNMAGSSGFYL